MKITIEISKTTQEMIDTINTLVKVPLKDDTLDDALYYYLESMHKDIVDGMWDKEDLR